MSATEISTQVNGQSVFLKEDDAGTALGFLRQELGLTATRFGCGLEQCGACHVLIDGQSKPTCQLPAADLKGRQVVTLESAQSDALPSTPYLKALQAAFVAEQAAQCGYCTSGLLMSAMAFLMNAHEAVTDGQIREALEPHLCRCGAHNRVLRAVKNAAQACGLKVNQSEVSA